MRSVRRTLSPLLLGGLIVAACSKSEPRPVDASMPPPKATGAGATSASPMDATAGGSADADAGVLSAGARAELLRDLADGRKRSRATDWPGALEAFDRALRIAPDDGSVLSEVGWAALQANDLSRAADANRRALANARGPKLRAPILYNMGRVAEARDQKDAASKAYLSSLALRDNAEVKKRLDGLGFAPITRREQANEICGAPMPSIEALCDCLLARPDELLTALDEKATCKRASAAPPLQSRLSIVEWGTEGTGEKAHILVVQEGDRVRSLGELGRDYEPGTHGTHNLVQVKGSELKTVNGHSVVAVRSEQNNSSNNLGGIALCTDSETLETVCARGDASGATRCAAIPVEIETGCILGVDPTGEANLDDAMKKMVADLKKAKMDRARATWTIADDGTVSVRVVEGSRDLFSNASLQSRSLW